MESKKYIVGAKKNPDGSVDYSRAAEQLLTPILSEKELRSLQMQLLSTTEFGKNVALGQLAKQKNVSPEQLLQEIRDYTKLQIRKREKGLLRHFHRTSIQNFRSVAAMGRLLSRSKIKQEKPEFDIPEWSTSDDVMMTRDRYDANGDMIKPGFDSQEVVGASGSGVMLVLKDEIMERKDYDATSHYPTISDLPLEKYCEVILVDSQQKYDEVKKILSANNLKIPIALKSNWKRDAATKGE